jgi:branched-chain amino acid transport system ATP-binding protein
MSSTTSPRETPSTPSPGDTTTEPLLEVDGVDAGYGDLQVLHGLSLELHPGTIEVVLGRNGVGKTTLLSTISGLVPVWRGALRLRGKEFRREPAHRRARAGIALVQEGKKVFHGLTVRQNVVLGTFPRKLKSDQRLSAATDLLAHFPLLDGMHDRRAADLSGGQQQMLAIAQALAGQPDVLLLDEPSAGLAPSIAATFFQEVRRMRDRGITVLLVEQLAELALGIADHVTVIDHGRVVDSGRPENFADRSELHEAYFGGGD